MNEKPISHYLRSGKSSQVQPTASQLCQVSWWAV